MAETTAAEKPSVLIIGGLGESLDTIYGPASFLSLPAPPPPRDSLSLVPIGSCRELCRRHTFANACESQCRPGYIGRFLALHIHNDKLASEVRLVDKVLPQLAWLAPEFEEACSASKFVQADASKERMCVSLYTCRPSALAPEREDVCCRGRDPVLLIPCLSVRREPRSDIRPRRRQAMGLRLQLRGRDEVFPGGGGLQAAVSGAVGCRRHRGGQERRQGVC